MSKTQMQPMQGYFEGIMRTACDSYDYECRENCRGLKVNIAVNIFGVGTLIPNDLGEELTSKTSILHHRNSQGSSIVT
ncbi:hypothetical protein [Pseudomonas yamanorum]|uniref:hypothetical protein n=1 Tax=Pseudomonas yamanorum TaxID=515393 RepID=UPI003D35C548